jgi:hypothetical protein
VREPFASRVESVSLGAVGVAVWHVQEREDCRAIRFFVDLQPPAFERRARVDTASPARGALRQVVGQLDYDEEQDAGGRCAHGLREIRVESQRPGGGQRAQHREDRCDRGIQQLLEALAHGGILR